MGETGSQSQMFPGNGPTMAHFRVDETYRPLVSTPPNTYIFSMDANNDPPIVAGMSPLFSICTTSKKGPNVKLCCI